MTLLFFDGFESPNLVQKPEWDVATQFLSASGRISGTAGQTNGQPRVLTLPAVAQTLYMGSAIFVGNTGYGDPWGSECFFNFQVGGVSQLGVSISLSGYVQVRLGGVGGTVIATATLNPITRYLWHSIQIQAKCHTSAGFINVVVNGTTVISFTGATANTSGPIDRISTGRWLGGGGEWHLNLDDMWVCNEVDATSTQGRPNNSDLGDLRVAVLLPTSAGDSTEWTPSTGANYAAVDEATPNTTDYVSANASGKRDLYQFADLPSNALSVLGLRVGLYAVKTDAGASLIKPVVKESGVVTVQTEQPLLTSYASFYGAPIYVKPSTESVFSAADINAIQAGVELS